MSRQQWVIAIKEFVAQCLNSEKSREIVNISPKYLELLLQPFTNRESLHDTVSSAPPPFSYGQNNDQPLRTLFPLFSIGDTSDQIGPATNINTYLPIEDFKKSPSMLFPKTAAARSFESSGTTSAQKSQSHFSRAGLDLYRFGSLATFFSVMEQSTSGRFWSMRGISLIPTTDEWRTSSLAQMVSWINDFAPLKYSTPEDLHTQITTQLNIDPSKIKQKSQIGEQAEPLWIFGTAFHLINYMDTSEKIQLPPGSIVIETGGTKGKSREIDRPDFYTLISNKFGIPTNQIISEYGMCELASQAYDFVPYASLKPEVPLEHRRFRFPTWVATSVTSGLNVFEHTGDGSLLVTDPLRIDYPWGIRTQDIARIDSPSQWSPASTNPGDIQSIGFSLKGRVPGSVLKGCSLKVEDLSEPQTPTTSADSALAGHSDPQKQKNSNAISPIPPFQSDQLASPAGTRQLDQAKITWLSLHFKAFINGKIYSEALTKEFGSPIVAEMTIDSLLSSAPNTTVGWQKAVRTSNGLLHHQECILIAPNNHSVAALYPITLGFLAGIKLSVRIPTRFSGTGSALNIYIDFLNSYLKKNNKSTNILRVDSSFRIDQQKDNDRRKRSFQSLIVYGSDETIAKIKLTYEGSIKAFGNHLCIGIIATNDIFYSDSSQAPKQTPHQTAQLAPRAGKLTENLQLISDLVDDFLAINQKGCLSMRALILTGCWTQERISFLCNSITSASRTILKDGLSVHEKTALDHLALDYLRQNIPTHARTNRNDILLPILTAHNSEASRASFGGSTGARSDDPCLMGELAKIHKNKRKVKTLHDCLAPIPYVLPLVRVGNDRVLIEKISSSSSPEIDLLMTKETGKSVLPDSFGGIEKISYKTPGSSQLIPWDGTSQGSPLFLFE